MRIKKFVAITMISLLLLTGCGGNDQKNATQQESQTQDTVNDQNESTAQTNTPEYSNSTTSQNVASQYYLSLGTLEKEVELEGNDRDFDEVEILNGKLIFPNGAIQSVVIKESDGKERFIQATEQEVRNLINALESVDCSGTITATSDKKSEVILVYKTKDTEYRTVSIESAENNHYLIRVKEDDRDEFAEIEDISDRNSEQDYDVVQVKSQKVSEIINHWIE
ncbi:MAG: hypothetical protein MR316_02810 [Lachnospiraceae bacterium]|nr:hypothetical protein [Lachnospiraceae bacterium]